MVLREQAGFLREAFDILKTTVQKWLDDKASRLAAALSFYTILSLASLLLLIVSIGGLVVRPDGIQKAVADQAESLIGDSGKELVRAVFANADRSSGILGTIFGWSRTGRAWVSPRRQRQIRNVGLIVREAQGGHRSLLPCGHQVRSPYGAVPGCGRGAPAWRLDKCDAVNGVTAVC